MNVIQVQRLADFPEEPVFAKRAKTIEEIQRWAQARNAETVLVYKHATTVRDMYTAVVLVVATAKDIEQASARLVTQAEGAA